LKSSLVEDDGSEGYDAFRDQDDEDEGKYYYDRPMSSYEMTQLRDGHTKYEIPQDNHLYDQYYPKIPLEQLPDMFQKNATDSIREATTTLRT